MRLLNSVLESDEKIDDDMNDDDSQVLEPGQAADLGGNCRRDQVFGNIAVSLQ